MALKHEAGTRWRQRHRAAPQAKICLNCGVTYIPASAVQKYCLDCRERVRKDYNIAKWAKIKQSPELLQASRDAGKRFHETHKHTSEYTSRRNASAKRTREARKNDPARMAKFRINLSIRWAERCNDPEVKCRQQIKHAKLYDKGRTDPEYMALRNSKRALNCAKEKEGLNAVPFFQAMAAAAAINDK
jgi:hypothetical protein